MIKVIDLFAGCGGFSLGFSKANFSIVSAVEFDKDIALSYKNNHPNTLLHVKDIKEIDNNLTYKKSDADVIIGGPPCQGFSMAGSRIRNGFIDDPRNYLFKHYFNIVRIVRPKIFIIENVKGLINMKGGGILNEIISSFENPSNFDGFPYRVQYKIFKSSEYGIPQKRERVIIFGSLLDFDLEKEISITKKVIKELLPHFFDEVTVWKAISNLPNPNNNLVHINGFSNEYQRYLISDELITWNHNVTNHSKKALNRIEKIKINQNYTALNEQINSVHSGSYGRLDPNGLASTITTRFDTPSGGKFIHPFQNRTLTPREAARIQSFPDNFHFYGTKTSIHKQIGNAVPPKLAFFIATMIGRLLCKEHT